MLQFFRNFTKSKLGVGLVLGFLVLIALAFASGDVVSSGKFGGVAGGDRAATVGKKRIDTSALSKAATTAFESMKQDNPRLSMRAFLAQGGLNEVLDQMLDRTAIGAFGESHGIIVGERLIDSEIAKLPPFKGPDGQFSETAYKQFLLQRGLTDKLIRNDLAQGMIAKQVLVPAAFGAVVPDELVMRYAALLKEQRIGAIALLPSLAFAPKTVPNDAEIAAFYTRNRNSFIRPERRVIRYASFDETVLKNVAAPTDAEIAARYEANQAKYAPSEMRRITQLIAPTEAAAQAILAEVTKGKSLEAVASSKGLSTAPLGLVSKQSLIGQSSQAVADAVFAAKTGAIAAPARSGLGWHLMRVDGIEAKAGRTLAQARDEIFQQLTIEKRRAALTDFSARIEDEFDNGGTLSDGAKELGLTLTETEPLSGDGQVYGKPGATAPAELARVVQTAFSMERENQPQLAEVEPGKKFVVFDVTRITASAPAPLAEIKSGVTAGLMQEKGAAAAKSAAEKVLAAVRKGTDLGAAMASLGTPLPPVNRITMGREQLAASKQGVPPPLRLLFSMAEGTVKLLPAPNNGGWFVVALKDIVPGTVLPNDPLLADAHRELGTVTGREYAEQLRRAIRIEVGVTRNESAISAVSRQLTGGN